MTSSAEPAPTPKAVHKPGRWRLSRRWFLRGLFYGAPTLALADGLWIEPNWLATRRISLSGGAPRHRFVFFTDLHHKGDRKLLDTVVTRINGLSPEFVCFGGDIIEDTQYLDDALAGLKQIKAPLYGVPGNHDYWSHADFNVIGEAFASTGGRWLMDEVVDVGGGTVQIAGATCMKPPKFLLHEGTPRIALIHYPLWVEKLGGHQFDLTLAGHSHGGQVRIPCVGPLITPFGVGSYDLGLFQTPAGSLYVGAGVGWFYLNIRFCCRPEITVVEI